MSLQPFAEAERFLAAADPVMRKLVRKHGPCGLKPSARRTPFESLARAIANQQLSGAVADKILARFIQLFPGRRFPRAEDLSAVRDVEIRAAGFSMAKIAALRDLAEKTLNGTVPTTGLMRKLEDHEIIERLTEVRGVGRWTAEMLLIFQLGRPDVLPADDFGVRKGFMRAFAWDGLPTPKTVLEHGERWKPARTVASWYLWREADGAGK